MDDEAAPTPAEDRPDLVSQDEVGAAASEGSHIGWPRAILSGVAIVIVAFLGAVYVPSLLLDALSSQSTQTRSLIVMAVSVTFVLVLAKVLRVLQRRGLI